MKKSIPLHGRDHRPGGSDPIPGIGGRTYLRLQTGVTVSCYGGTTNPDAYANIRIGTYEDPAAVYADRPTGAGMLAVGNCFSAFYSYGGAQTGAGGVYEIQPFFGSWWLGGSPYPAVGNGFSYCNGKPYSAVLLRGHTGTALRVGVFGVDDAGGTYIARPDWPDVYQPGDVLFSGTMLFQYQME